MHHKKYITLYYSGLLLTSNTIFLRTVIVSIIQQSSYLLVLEPRICNKLSLFPLCSLQSVKSSAEFDERHE